MAKSYLELICIPINQPGIRLPRQEVIRGCPGPTQPGFQEGPDRWCRCRTHLPHVSQGAWSFALDTHKTKSTKAISPSGPNLAEIPKPLPILWRRNCHNPKGLSFKGWLLTWLSKKVGYIPHMLGGSLNSGKSSL